MEPLVDVLMPVYNHEKFIEDALLGVVIQKTDFKYRLLVGEDRSTDGSRAIIQKYERDYPDIVVPFYRERNLGGFQNSKLLFQAVTAKYIAVCEGDDFWTDPHKLQRQVTILEDHPEYSGCFHNTEERFEDNENLASTLYCNYPAARAISFNDLSYGNMIPTCSAVYREKMVKNFPDWYYKLKMGDWPIHLLNAQIGDYWYLPQIMGVHRLHSKSMWMLQDQTQNNQYIIDAYDIMIEAFSKNPEYVNSLQKGKAEFIRPPKQVSYIRRGINFARKVKQKLPRWPGK